MQCKINKRWCGIVKIELADLEIGQREILQDITIKVTGDREK